MNWHEVLNKRATDLALFLSYRPTCPAYVNLGVSQVDIFSEVQENLKTLENLWPFTTKDK